MRAKRAVALALTGCIVCSALAGIIYAPTQLEAQTAGNQGLGGGVSQTGSVSSGHIATWAGTGVIQDGGGGAGSGTVTEIDTGTGLTGGPVTTSGTLSLSVPVTAATGGTGQTTYTDGQLLIGNTTGNTISKSTLTAGTGVSITNGHGSVTLTNSGVTSLTVSAGISASAGTGSIALSNSGVTSIVAGTNVTISGATGAVTISSSGGGGGSGCTTSGSIHDILTDDGAGGCASDAHATVTNGALALGASGTAGSVALGNATSGVITLQPVTGALGTVTASLPANSGTIAELNLAETWTADQTYNANIVLGTGVLLSPADGIQIQGSGAGVTQFDSLNASGTNYTIHYPAANGTVALTSGVVSALTAGTGISVSASTGSVTVTNTGVTSATAGTGIGVSGATGGVTFTNSGVTSLTGTTGISLSAGTGAVTVSLTQPNSSLSADTTISSSNFGNCYTLTGSHTLTINSGVIGSGQNVCVQNDSSGSWTIAGTETINGLVTAAIGPGEAANFLGNGTNVDWFAGSQRGSSTVRGTVLIPVPIASGGTALTTTPTDGQLLIGKTGTNAYVQGTVTAGTGVSVTNGSGSITLTNSGVTSLAATAPVSVSGSTGGVTISLTDANVAFTDVTQSFTKGQRGSFNTLTLSTATATPNFDNANNFVLTLTSACPCTLANPSAGVVAGQSGMIALIQDATGSRTVGAMGTLYAYVGGVSAITLSTGANARDYLPYVVNSDASLIVLGGIVKGPTH